MMRFFRRSLLVWGLIGVPLLLAIVLLGPTLVARAQVNLFSIGLARLWTTNVLQPTHDACPRVASAEALDALRARLAQADGADAHLALHQGELACLAGDVGRAGDIWRAGLDAGYSVDPVLLLDASIALFSKGVVLETAQAGEISQYAAKRSSAVGNDDLAAAIGWQEMAFAYHPSFSAGDRLASLYHKAGREDDVAQVWMRLQAARPEDDEDRWLARARLLALEEDWAGAYAAYIRAAELAPKSKNAYRDYRYAAGAARKAGLFDDFVAAYKRAIDLNPNRIDAYLNLGEAYRLQKQYDKAVEWFVRVQKRFPEDYRPSFYLGLTAMNTHEYEKALAYFDESLALRSNNPGALYYKAQALDALQRRSVAIQALSQAIAHHSKPPESWQKLLDKWLRYPDYAQDPGRWWKRGQAAEKEKDWARAATLYAEGAGKAQPPDDYRLLEREALMHRYLKEWDKAADLYDDLVKRYPDKIDAYLGLGETYRAQGRYEEAASWFQRARELFPDDYRPPYYLGLVARAQKRHDDALAYFDQSLGLKPNNPSVLYYKATVLDALQRRSEAIETLTQALALMKKKPEGWQKLLDKWLRYPDYAQDPGRWWKRGQAAEKEKDWARAATLYAEGAGKAQPPDDYRLLEREALMHRYLKEWDKAADLYDDLVKRYPDKIDAYLGLGETYRAQGRYEEAASWFQRARELFPDDYRPPYYLGVTALNAHEYDEALAYFDEALALKPGYVYAFYYKAQTLKAMGRVDEAIVALSQAIELHPSHPESWKEQLSQWQGQH